MMFAPERYMRAALALARLGTGSVSPNPRVGCVITDPCGGDVIASGHHRKFGGPHAEIDALAMAGERAHGSDVYVTLEPCSHTGKTPPCADALVRAGVGRVFIGAMDTDPLVSGRGAEKLRAAGIEVVIGVLEKECRYINRGFFSARERGRPWVTVKAAVSVDGAMAAAGGESKWITNAESRRRAHMIRAEHDAILVGAGTIVADDPRLDVRDADGSDPLKVVIDPHLRTPPDARVYSCGRAVIFALNGASEDRTEAFEARDVRVIRLEADSSGAIAPEAILAELAGMGVGLLLIEGGARTIDRFLAAHLVDEMSVFTAPKVLGGGNGLAAMFRADRMDDALCIKAPDVRDIDGDVWIRGEISCSRA